ncbi:MAG: carbonic anhydrase family protein [Candidatus Scalindua sp. AMX11]|nr:MAG: carbonic anhydrase family protein [Candidatus Scalindua sp.]NOG84963.1 carbonic anhydrase family protein [Planctomycetota bacterium]RZV93019.1 MAG: carbonic anhydrase family protein [Candidatus Scalindua sp. SCAELEC01]TDE66639.1 MAG: carbonic anhydrase family protein [Candidatus Scalindua sp. AMX11]GJQ57946.1 MAG: carbonic anhydrase [Candidatus Scalindua sp.]
MKLIITICTVFLMSSFHIYAEEDTVHAHKYHKEQRLYYWEHLDSKCTVCGSGGTQSPINISKCKKRDLGSLEFSYRETPLKAINNGHTIKVEYERGSTVTIEREEFTLLEFHFHHPSEHKIRGKTYDMEIHFVHRSESKGFLSVVSVFINEGKHNVTIEPIWDNIFEGIDEKNQLVPLTINAEELLPDDRSYYYYYGSVTTPPCSEGVNWYIFKSPIEMSNTQIKKFETVIGFNARPVQPINYRLVFESK